MSVTHDPGGKSKPKWRKESVVTAVFSQCDLYRYQLAEIWDADKPMIMWLMMNPSVATTDYSDPTLMKTGGFSRRWGYGGQLIGNVHAYRITDSKLLAKVADPVGPGNDAALLDMAYRSQLIMLAYGQPPKPLRPRARCVVEMLRGTKKPMAYLRLTKAGVPWHPLYLPNHLEPRPYP